MFSLPAVLRTVRRQLLLSVRPSIKQPKPCECWLFSIHPEGCRELSVFSYWRWTGLCYGFLQVMGIEPTTYWLEANRSSIWAKFVISITKCLFLVSYTFDIRNPTLSLHFRFAIPTCVIFQTSFETLILIDALALGVTRTVLPSPYCSETMKLVNRIYVTTTFYYISLVPPPFDFSKSEILYFPKFL